MEPIAVCFLLTSTYQFNAHHSLHYPITSSSPFLPSAIPPIFPSPCCLPRNLNQVNDVDYIIAGDRIVTVDGAFLPPGEIVA